MPRIAWIEDKDASGETAEIFAHIRTAFGGEIPDLLRAFSQRPGFMAAMSTSAAVHFAPGALTRAQHEMIATYVATLSQCTYCVAIHSSFLSSIGEEYRPVAEALSRGDLLAAPITDAERKLLALVGTITEHSFRITDLQIQDLRDSGWSDPQIAEAVYLSSLWNLFVRVTNAFGLVLHIPQTNP
jgi:uncharacterized peroxidase-related enzyme